MSKVLRTLQGAINPADMVIQPPALVGGNKPSKQPMLEPRPDGRRIREPKAAPPPKVPLNVAIDPDLRDALHILSVRLKTPVRELAEDCLWQLVRDHE
ncbi:MAG: hypothetical protein ACRYG8_05660 [Janthinobacterium lividum]